VREGHRFDLLERVLQSATERNSSHTSVSVSGQHPERIKRFSIETYGK